MGYRGVDPAVQGEQPIQSDNHHSSLRSKFEPIGGDVNISAIMDGRSISIIRRDTASGRTQFE